MRLPAAALAALLSGCTAAAGPETVARAAAGSAEDYARQLFSGFHERIVEVEEHRSGPGAVLTHVDLYERPEAAPMQGLCQVRVHKVIVPHAPPPHDPPREALAVNSGTRFYAVGPVGPGLRPADQETRCAALPSARHFFSASPGDAQAALQMLTDARMFAESMPRAIAVECASFRNACGDPAEMLRRHLTPDRVSSVTRVACGAGRPGRGESCFLYAFRPLPDGLGGDWSLNLKGPERPMHAVIRHEHPPVS